ncbi:uncharacterized protein LOC132050422 isoform X2 [Lycium ferocissimum]|uniref:uncharacterized protein LOC132050422 isoform X2 n=1 Tax=Lycium ferocissimum TaxID=112874 RepID=UPI002814E5BE|nr:uncharacterized protein LOC132050422 isoform X2 [Lycium ferocissimum]
MMHFIVASGVGDILFLFSVLFLYSISPADDAMVFMGFVCVQVAPIMAFVMIYEICSSRRARDRTRSTSTNYLSCCDELHHYVPSSEACPIRRRLQELRHQIALLNRESYEFVRMHHQHKPCLLQPQLSRNLEDTYNGRG